MLPVTTIGTNDIVDAHNKMEICSYPSVIGSVKLSTKTAGTAEEEPTLVMLPAATGVTDKAESTMTTSTN